MQKLEERIDDIINEVNSIHNSIVRTNWKDLNREGFVFELETNTQKFKAIFITLEELNRELKLLLERGTPTLDNTLSEISREIVILDANLNMEKTKKLKDHLVNEIQKEEVPELYDSIQRKMTAIILRARNDCGKIKTFLMARNMPFVKKGSTAKLLIELMQKQEEELKLAQEQNLELKRKSFFGAKEEINSAEIEKELHETDKILSESVNEASKSLKTHHAQITYVEGSFAHLKEQIDKVEAQHASFSKKALDLIKDLKKERDFARNIALGVEAETISIKNSYTHQLLGLEKKKNEIEENTRRKYENEMERLRKELMEKTHSLNNLARAIHEQEKEIARLKEKQQN